jgi:P27 family predicted phage terminase small subunit
LGESLGRVPRPPEKRFFAKLENVMRGRKPKPTKLKLVTGNPGKRRLNVDEPQPRLAAPSCPKWLSKRAKAKWRQLAPELSALGLLTIVDGDPLAAYCQAFAELELATQTLEKEGRTIIGSSGRTVAHPCVAQQRSAMRAVKDFAALFGLDPSSRSRLKPSESREDEFERFLKHA